MCTQTSISNGNEVADVGAPSDPIETARKPCLLADDRVARFSQLGFVLSSWTHNLLTFSPLLSKIMGNTTTSLLQKEQMQREYNERNEFLVILTQN